MDRIVALLKQRGFVEISQMNHILSRKHIYFVDQEFKNHRLEYAKSNGTFLVNWFNESFEPKTTTPITQESILTTLKIKVFNSAGNRFGHEKQRIKYRKMNTINSHFDDLEAVDICSKMVSSFARSKARDFLTNKGSKEEVRYILHYIANKALRMYGGQLIEFIYGLRKLDFKNTTAEPVRNYKDVGTEFPTMTFVAGNDELTISFYKRRFKHLDIGRPWFSSGNKFIGTLNKQGELEMDPLYITLSEFRPLIEIYVEKMKTGKYKITSGIETGVCSVCGKELTDPDSLRYGVGPVCRQREN